MHLLVTSEKILTGAQDGISNSNGADTSCVVSDVCSVLNALDTVRGGRRVDGG